jgi:hypothetical protein
VAFEQTKTVEGVDVIIYQRDVGFEKRIHGAYKAIMDDGQEDWFLMSWDSRGRMHDTVRRKSDLIESQPKMPTKAPRGPSTPSAA